MTMFCHDQPPNSSSKRCRSLSSSVKNAFSNCHTCKRSRSVSSYEDETPTTYFSDELEVVSIVRARAMEAKLRRKSIPWNESFSSVFYHVTLSEHFKRTAKQQDKEETNNDNSNKRKQDENNNDEKEEDVLSVVSHFSSACSAASEFFSVKTRFSECSSLKGVGELFPELRRRSIIQEFSHCKGWPFGLCRRAVLLPPLLKSPSDSWSWCKSTKNVNFHLIIA